MSIIGMLEGCLSVVSLSQHVKYRGAEIRVMLEELRTVQIVLPLRWNLVAYMTNDAEPKAVIVGRRYFDLIKACHEQLGPAESCIALEELEGWRRPPLAD